MTTFLPRPATSAGRSASERAAAGSLPTDRATAASPAADRASGQVTVCPVGSLVPGRGVAALLPDGRQVAVFLVDDEVHALCNIDPVARAAVMSRGLVGDRGGVPVVISPLGKQAYAIADGRGLDDPSRGLSVFPARITEAGTVVISTEPAIGYSMAA